MTVASSNATPILELPPSSIEVCQWDNRCFAIGTYYLEKKNDAQEPSDDKPQVQKRSGSVLLVQLTDGGNGFELVQNFPTDYAVLDLHFPNSRSLSGKQRCIWTANSTGSLACYTLAESSFNIQKFFISQLWERNILVLSFTFHPTNSKLLGATLSDGNVTICSLSENLNKATLVMTISTHELEAWTMSFAVSGERCLSGGDDAVLQYVLAKGTSIPGDGVMNEDQIHSMLIWKDRRLHSAGVTALLPLEDSIAITGSYDDNMRIITLDKPSKLLAEINLGGGVWRLKRLHAGVRGNTRKYDILASCMHAGARIVRITIGEGSNAHGPTDRAEIEVLARFEEHESMNYGSDFVRNGYEYTILSTSFYDKRLCLWKFHTEDFGSGYKSAEGTVDTTEEEKT
jgi:diphthamide biosynthesis protein 7